MDLISDVSEELAYFIYTEKKACLPGIGCFEAVYQSAILDPITNTLQAPAQTIHFGIAKEEDQNFVQFLAEQLPGKETYESFKQNIIDLLMSDTEVALPGLGQLKANGKGEISFKHTENDDFNLDFDDLVLTPIPTIEDPAENVASNAPRAATEKTGKNKDEGLSFLRIAMLAIVSALCLSIYMHKDIDEPSQPIVKLVNISPKANQNEVYIAEESASGIFERLAVEDKAEIIKRQDAMTAPSSKKAMYKAQIITNTFGDRVNADRQIEFIKSLGYQTTELEKGSGLISTVILLSYDDKEELSALLKKIKKDFPRAKVNK